MIRALAIAGMCTVGALTYYSVWGTLTSHSDLRTGDIVVTVAAVAVATGFVVWRSR